MPGLALRRSRSPEIEEPPRASRPRTCSEQLSRRREAPQSPTARQSLLVETEAGGDEGDDDNDERGDPTFRPEFRPDRSMIPDYDLRFGRALDASSIFQPSKPNHSNDQSGLSTQQLPRTPFTEPLNMAQLATALTGVPIDQLWLTPLPTNEAQRVTFIQFLQR